MRNRKLSAVALFQMNKTNISYKMVKVYLQELDQVTYKPPLLEKGVVKVKLG